jgi:hypothetical protein
MTACIAVVQRFVLSSRRAARVLHFAALRPECFATTAILGCGADATAPLEQVSASASASASGTAFQHANGTAWGLM